VWQLQISHEHNRLPPKIQPQQILRKILQNDFQQGYTWRNQLNKSHKIPTKVPAIHEKHGFQQRLRFNQKANKQVDNQ